MCCCVYHLATVNTGCLAFYLYALLYEGGEKHGRLVKKVKYDVEQIFWAIFKARTFQLHDLHN